MSEALQALRQAFDRGFVEAPLEDEVASEELVVVQVGHERLAFRLSALGGLERARRVVPLPGGPAALVGLAGLRGRVVPVFGLAALVGQPAEPLSGWFAVIGQEEPIGLAFDALVGVEVVAASAIVQAEAATPGAIVPESARLATGLVGVVRVEAVWAALVPPVEED